LVQEKQKERERAACYRKTIPPQALLVKPMRSPMNCTAY
jgi:hypothetical protein